MKIKMTPHNLFISLGLMALFLVQAPLQFIINKRPEHAEIVRVNPFKTLPPVDYLAQYLAGTLLGGFRPLIVDYLWMKTSDLQEDKKFEEIRTLLQLIALLQPRMQEVWTYNGWNMAYNISNQEETLEKQWDWINGSIKFMEEEGLKHNPDSHKIAFWIAFIYWNRIPQEPYFMEATVKKHGQDTFWLAAHYYQKAIELSEKHNPNATISYESLYAASRYYHSFELLKKEQFEEAIFELNNQMLYLDKSIKKYPVEINRLTSERNALNELLNIFKLEKELAAHRKGKGKDEQFFSLLTTVAKRYAQIIQVKFNIDFRPINQRVDMLLNESVSKTYELIDQGNFTGAQATGLTLIKNTQQLIPTDTQSPAYYFYEGLVLRFTDFNNIITNECLFRQAVRQNKLNEAAHYLKETIRLMEDYSQKYKVFDLSAELARARYLKNLGSSEQK